MLLLRRSNYSDEDSNNYRSNVHHPMTLREKIRNATVSYVTYVNYKQSPLIPMELQLEVKDFNINIPPNVMTPVLDVYAIIIVVTYPTANWHYVIYSKQ